MKKLSLGIVLLVLALLPVRLSGQSFSALWKQADDAAVKDLPKTQISVLEKIEAKAEAEKSYGHLLKAVLLKTRLTSVISPDSLHDAVGRMEWSCGEATEPVLKAVYAAVLNRIYTENPQLDDSAKVIAQKYGRMAMANPKALAAVKSDAFEPMVIKGYNGKIFDNDMLSVVGYEVGDFKTLCDYYHSAGNREAACLSALELIKQHKVVAEECVNKSEYINWLDSLINVYEDVDVACEAAIERYDYMNSCQGVTAEQKISYIHYALDKWGAWQNVGVLRNAERELTTPRFTMNIGKRVVEPGVAQTMRINDIRNISSLQVNIYKTAEKGDTELDPANADDYKKLSRDMVELKELAQERRYMSHPDYQFFEDSLEIPSLTPGVYMIEVTTSPQTETVRMLYYVTDVFLLSHALPQNKTRYVVVSATTGHPIADANIRIDIPGNDNGTALTTTLTCDVKGEAIFVGAKRQRTRVYAYTDGDRFCPDASTYSTYSYYASARRTERTRVFTDRSIYRPGQTVHVSAVVYETTDNVRHEAVKGKQVKALLRDANFKIVAEKDDLLTDDYGTCAVDFILPSGSLNGNFTVFVNNSSARIRVEEYKRPTFRVEFPKINERYEAGDTLEVRAKALSFAGVPVQGAKVKYTVKRSVMPWWRQAFDYVYSVKSFPTAETDVLLTGEAMTDANGVFTVLMPMSLPELPGSVRMFYNIVATADVTDVSGETRTGELSVPLGSKPTAFSCDLAEKVLSDSLRAVTFMLRNASGEPISAAVRFRIDDRAWLEGKTSEPVEIGTRIESGRHRLFAVCENDTLEREFLALAIDDTKPCVDTRSWFYVSDEKFRTDGRPVTLQVGSSDSAVHIVYCIASGDSILESGAVDCSNELINRKFTYKEEYGNGLLLTYAWVKNGQCYTFNKSITRPLPDTKLRLKWTTFRDRLVPGQREEWRLSITNPDGTPAKAQLMATLYDMSLDQITPHSWTLEPQTWLAMPYANWDYARRWGFGSTAEQAWKPFAYRALELDRFDDSVFPYAFGSVLYALDSEVGGIRPMMRTAMAETAKLQVQNGQKMAKGKAPVAEVEMTADAAASVSGESTQHTADKDNETGDQLRENLNETAFFYPALETDADGGIALKFTLPESVTTWRFMGLAHTKDMFVGSINGEAVAKKDVMIIPNVPRFVRVGDKATITARIMNTGMKALKGTARMVLIDPETEKTVLQRSENVAVEAGSTGSVAFEYSPDGSSQLLICRVTIDGNGFSDGEQHYLPVLPDRERITVTAPFVQNGPGTVALDVADMFPKGSSDRQLTVEYTNNPAWLVVQSLPYVGTARDNNAIDQAAVIYSNAIGRYLIGGSQRVKTMVDSWKMETPDAQSLASSLDKNAELKDIVLSETPWVADADTEAEQKQHMADFFDESLTENRISTAVGKLQGLQNSDGSWSWWPDMPGNLNMTVEVAEILVRLNAIAGRCQQTSVMLDKAFGYMERQMGEMVDMLKDAVRNGRQMVLDDLNVLRYLYICAVDGRRQSASAKADADYLVSMICRNIKEQTIYDKALTAIILNKRGDKAKSKEYAQSLKEFTVYTDDAGRYYDTPRAGYSWRDYRIPTEVAAIEALALITPEDSVVIDEMRRWLLHEKRAQAWNTPINSVNAVYAFMYGDPGLLSPKTETVISIDGKALELPAATAGLGYVKKVIDSPRGKEFTAKKASTGTSWGALYAQFMQKTADVEASGSGITVRRELLTDHSVLRIGSRLKVRLTIKADRDMDFVQVVDRRAACMEPVEQLSGYRNGAYCSPKDNATYYYFDKMRKGVHVLETEYYIDRAGLYETGTCTVSCAYAPEYRGTTASETLEVRQ